MQITLNGEVRSFEHPQTILGLIGELELDVRKIAIERNLEIVSKEAFETTTLNDNDVIEIVHFIGGG